MTPTRADLGQQLKGTLIVLAWLTLAVVFREANYPADSHTPEVVAQVEAGPDPVLRADVGPRDPR